MRTLAILPVKSFPKAKRRLGQDVDPGNREALVEAMFSDVLSSLRSTSVERIMVITRSPAARRIALQQGAEVLPDLETGHNAAAALGIEAALARGFDRALLVPGDCPALDPLEVDGLLRRPATAPQAVIVPDRHGTGTNALLLTPPDALAPSFGPGSCQRHVELAQASGTNVEVVEVASLALDIDTPEDLESLSGALAPGPDRARMTRRLVGQMARC